MDNQNQAQQEINIGAGTEAIHVETIAQEEVIGETKPNTDAVSKGEIQEPAKKEEIIEDEPKDNKARTHLGMKVANLERNLTDVLDKFSKYLEQTRPDDKVQEVDVFAGKSEEDYLTVAEVRKAMDSRLRQEKEIEKRAKDEETKKWQDYEAAFLMKLYEKDPENYNAIREEINADINDKKKQVIYTGNAEIDALANYEVANARLMVKKINQSPEKKKSAIEQRIIPKTGTGFDINSSTAPSSSKFKRKPTDEEMQIITGFGITPEMFNAIED